MTAKDSIVSMYQKYEVDTLTITGGITGKSNPILSRGHKSSNEIVLALTLNDVD